VLILLAPNDRKYRIEVGYGLEPILPDGKVAGSAAKQYRFCRGVIMMARPFFLHRGLRRSSPKIEKSHWTPFPARRRLPLNLSLHLFTDRTLLGFSFLLFSSFSGIGVHPSAFLPEQLRLVVVLASAARNPCCVGEPHSAMVLILAAGPGHYRENHGALPSIRGGKCEELRQCGGTRVLSTPWWLWRPGRPFEPTR